MNENTSQRNLAGILIGLATLPSPAIALEADEDFFGTFPVVLSAARIAQTNVESPVSFSVLDEEAIRATGARDIPELFRILPGFQVGYFTGNRPVVTYHGLADQFARRMQVLIDGRSAYVPIFGGVPWESLPLSLEDIVRIEVVRGPNAASYGPNSFSGVISITTRHASEDSGVLVSLTGGDRAFRDGVLRTSTNVGDLDVRTTLGYTEDEGFDDVHDNRRARYLNIRSDYSINARDTIMLQAAINTGATDVGIAGRLGDPERESEPSYNSHHLRWERNWSAERALVVQYYFNRYRIEDTFPIETNLQIDPFPPFQATTFVDFDSRSERHDIELQYNFAPTDTLRLVTGGSARRDEVSAVGLLGAGRTLRNESRRLFIHSELALDERINLNAGAMVENNDITGTDTSPKAGLLYKLDRNQSLRYGVSQATRTPVFIEDRPDSRFDIDTTAPPPFDRLLDIVLVSEGGLEPEQITSQELGYRLVLPGTDLDVRVFYDEMDKIIVQEEVDPVAEDTFDGEARTFVNRVEAEFYGIEAQLDTTLAPEFRLITSLSYARANARARIPAGTDSDRAEEARDQARDVEDSLPLWTGGLLGIYRLGGGSFISFDYNYIEDLDWAGKMESFTTRKLDIQYSRSFMLGGQSARLALNLENVLGDYTEYQSENVVEPGGYVRFSMHYR